MDKVSYVGNADVNAIEHLYQSYKKDPESVEPGWQKFFEGFEFAQTDYENDGEIPENFQKEFKVLNLINGYRSRGHLFTQTNPVRERRKYAPTLDIENFGLTEADLDLSFQAGSEIGIGTSTLREIIDHLKASYCQSIGIEYAYMREPERKAWFMNRVELKNRPHFTPEQKKAMFMKLNHATIFEQFLQKKYVGQKRFSVEGGEALISGLNHLVTKGAKSGVEEFVVGMAHRGRLNTLVNIFDKDFEQLFREFDGKEFEEDESFDGDVKYHMGESGVKNIDGKDVRLTLAPNPSHLEAVDPVVEGIVRAKIDDYIQSEDKIVPVLVHGDGAIAGQGIVYEVIQMAQLDGYRTGGTIHIVVNNQVGFTTNYLDARSSTYCTDVAKTTLSPVFHVNGDDIEAVSQVMEIALDYRQKFKQDIFIDLLCYRKYGHNEGDEPKFTQPTLYKAIAKHPNPREIYLNQLVAEGIMTAEEGKEIEVSFTKELQEKFDNSKKEDKASIKNFIDHKNMDGFITASAADFEQSPDTSFDKDKLYELGKKITTLPEGKKYFRKVEKLFKDRVKMIEKNELDWGTAEMLAYGSLLSEGHPVRISGQDVERGTFSHRHAVVKTEDNEEEILTLNLLSEDQAKFTIYNSLLSEYGVLGFDYGYSLAQQNGLTIWEAQFGDFMNGAQIMIDQFIYPAEDKWKVQSGLVMLLPHGYEGQGAEHSSARLERFLQNCGDLNVQVVNSTTPANHFHALRRQLKREFRKPLVVMSPKMLLRYPKAVSSMDELANGRFQEVIDDPRNIHASANAVVLCSGKVYYDFIEEAEKRNITDVAFVRVEQLYPLPKTQIDAILAKYKNADKVIWGQEEPENMGAWTHIAMELRGMDIEVVARPRSSAPACGSKVTHTRRLKNLFDNLFVKAGVTA